MSAVKSPGQVVIEKVETWIESFIVFPNEHMALVAALWAINTWIFEAFDATPYLAITARSKRAGKTTLLDLLKFLSRNAESGGAGTPAAMYSLMDMHGGQCSLFFDEAERMSSGAVGMMRTFMNFGYRKGESIPRKIGKEVIKFPCYGPKAFALIGDPTDTLRDRSILFVMERSVGPRPYRPSQAAAEAQQITKEIRTAVALLKGKGIVCPEWLTNRDQEIWEPLWSIAVGLGCDAALLARLTKAASWLVAGKGAEIRRFTETAETEAEWEAQTMGEKVLRDLATCFKDGEQGIRSTDAITRLRAIGTSPWANYKGVGLDAITLAALVAPLGVKPAQLRLTKGNREQVRAYSRASVMASIPSDDK